MTDEVMNGIRHHWDLLASKLARPYCGIAARMLPNVKGEPLAPATRADASNSAVAGRGNGTEIRNG
jgi:hypothetical protein